ncbi:MAG TPA: hemolysin family protein [Acidimicrobiales bacterium]|nr:hemolysin family protein [Acidimicrobiales bacterium]
MTPRVDVMALPAPVRFADVAQAVRRTGHSHFPVYEGDLDRLSGVLFVKDLFHGDKVADGDGDLSKRVRDPFIVPETRNALELLAEMRKLRRGFAVVVDEYGGVAGVVTINDLVSELVGDIRDEYDRSESPSIIRVDQTRYLIDGAVDVDEVRDNIGMLIPDGEYVTLGGFLFERFGRIPDEGDELEWDGYQLRVERMDKRRIAKVVVRAPSATISPGEADDAEPYGK